MPQRPGDGGARAAGRPSNRFRPDVEGLRAWAVVAVVLYHAHVRALGGGFAGVDVFFVVSGYLITGLLWRELRRRGRVSMAAFYGRRARRLLPAAILVVVVTAVAARRWLPPLELPQAMKDGVASAFYVGNYRFAVEQTNYLNATAAPSPFQHFWSLGVEEQFYLLWPLLLVAGGLMWRTGLAHGTRRRRASRRGVCLVLAALTAVSFGVSVWLTAADQPWAFFSLPARAWELGAGALLALAAPALRRLPRRPAVALGWAGVAAVVASMMLIGPRTPFPGWAALAPVAGALAVLASGDALQVAGLGRLGPRSGPVRLLGLRPVQYVGRISYSWYLWHWPFLVLAPQAVGHPLTPGQNLVVVGMSGVVAAASYHLVEAPARSSAWLTARSGRSLLTGGSLSAAGAAACLAIALTVPSLAGHGTMSAAALSATPATGTSPTDVAEPTTAPTPAPTTVDPVQAQIHSVNGQLAAQVAASVGIQAVPSNLTPSLPRAKTDEPVVMVDGCMDSYLARDVEHCSFGDTSSTTKVVLFGDSHAAMWFPALDFAANQYGWNLYTFAKATCPPLELRTFSPDMNRDYTECYAWRQNVLDRLAQLHPALVVLDMARHYTSIYDFTPFTTPWLDALSQMVSTLRAMGSQVLVIGPVPKPAGYVPDCLSRHLYTATACTVPLERGVNLTGRAAEQAAVVAAGGRYLDVEPWFCTSATCAAIVGNILVWRDDNHLTDTYARFLGPAMSAFLPTVLTPPGARPDAG